MNFVPTDLEPATVVELERVTDERGFFARTWSSDEFRARNLNAALVQCSLSFNKRKGTLRGLHFQKVPHAEAKLVRCTGGEIYDVIVDLRSDSPTLKQWFGTHLSSDNRRSLYVPEGFAHGFITLTDEAEVFYQISEPYTPAAAAGVRWDDPAFGIDWPIRVTVISERDANYPDFIS